MRGQNELYNLLKNLSRPEKILFSTILIFIFSFKQIATAPDFVITHKFTLANARLTNEFSEREEFSEAEKTVEAFMRRWSIAGASVAIAKDGKLIYSKGFGYADKASMTPVQPYSKFRIASISKLVTAVAIMKLAEEGRLSLDNKVFGSDGILNDPYFSNPVDRQVFEITVEHLLSHEGGWSQRFGDQMFMSLFISETMGVNPPADVKTIIRFALNKRLHFKPGTDQSYSNLGYAILGLVIEKITGTTYEEYCQKAVLEPLGIYDMAIAGNLQSEKAIYEVTYYEPSNAALRKSIYETGEMTPASYGGNDIRTLGAAGAWIATAPDLMRLLLAVDGFSTRPDILSQESINRMTGNRRAPLGWRSVGRDGVWQRTGSFSGTSGMMSRQPNGISWVVLLNSSTWNGSTLQTHINEMMTKAISQINELPDYNLFHYSLPVPVTPPTP